jgi:hypothetical protein
LTGGVKRESSKSARITEDQLHNWGLVESFREILEQVYGSAPLPPTFQDPRRTLGYAPYFSLFLLGLFNPVVTSMRGLCAASHLPRVQKTTGGAAVSLGSFSEMQSVVDPSLLYEVFQELVHQHQAPALAQPDPRLAELNLLAQDGSLWRALPRMTWAEYGVGPDGEAKGVRLHLRFHLVRGVPWDAQVTAGKSCERQALRDMLVAGQISVGDRYYGEDYRLFGDVDRAGAFFVFRIKDNAIIHQEEALPLSEADRAAGVVRHAWVRLGASESKRSLRVRLVEIRTSTQHLLLVTNLPAAQGPADLVGLIYRRRWQIELFFRWIKCILRNRHLFAESPQGVTIQLYLALIASVLFQMYTGRRPTKRQMEAIQFFLMGWASAEDLAKLLKRGEPKGSSAKIR